MRTILWAAPILAMAAAWPERAAADDAEPGGGDVTEKVIGLEVAVAQHEEDEDEGALIGDLGRLVDLYRQPTVEEEHKDKLRALLGTILRDPESDTVARAALKAVGDLGDEDNWKYVRRYVQQPNPKVAPPLLLEGIACAGKIRARRAVEPLLKIVEDSKVYASAAAAIRALSNYGDVKSKRVRIIEVIIKSVRKSVPGGNARKKGPGENADPGASGYTSGRGDSDTSRWGALAPAMVEAVNKLTGKVAGTPEDWFELYDRYKGRLDDLFER